MKNNTSFEVIEEAVNNQVDRMNKVDNVSSYIASLDRPTTGQYVAMPDGTIQFIRQVMMMNLLQIDNLIAGLKQNASYNPQMTLKDAIAVMASVREGIDEKIKAKAAKAAKK